MANEKNLIPIRSSSEAREKGRKGGIESGKSRREKKSYKKLAETMLSATITNANILAELKAYGIEETNVKAYTLLGMIKASAAGSHSAFRELLKLTEEDAPNDLSKLDEILEKIEGNI